MANYKQTDEEIANVNLSNFKTKVYVNRLQDATKIAVSNWVKDVEFRFSKIQIKETDMRIKTASFSMPYYTDLTTGVYSVLITSPYYENFSGIILNCELDEKTGLYSYQCQDWSRKHQTKLNMYTVNTPLYDILRHLITGTYVSLVPKQDELEKNKQLLAGLRPASDYNQADWGSIVRFNPMTQTQSIIVKDKPRMQVIRDLVYGTGAYIDIYFDDYGAIQIEPYHRKDWENTGVHINKEEVMDVKVKFDTTNIISRVTVKNTDDAFEIGTSYGSDILVNFFGLMSSTATYKLPTQNTSSGGSSTSTGDAWNSKAKKIWINADNGSGNMKNEIANLLKSKGWSVHVGGTCSNCHYSDYYNVTSDYQVYATVYNGFCAGTVREAYSSTIQNTLKNKGVTLVIMWDTHDWTSGMKPYRYGDFTGYNAGRAWDDNFSSSDPSINNVASWLKSKNAIYCANPTAEGIVNQFLAGGYFKSVGK